MNKLEPYALKDVPNLIESGIFPVQKLSYEAQRERKSVHGQTLTSLGTYWKGRKPLILVRAIILGLLLPRTDNLPDDLKVFEKLLAFDDGGLARRALAKGSIKPKDILCSDVSISNVQNLFTLPNSLRQRIKKLPEDVRSSLETSKSELNSVRWNKNITQSQKLILIERYLSKLESYTKKASLCKRPEEVNQDWLYENIWPVVCKHYSNWHIDANSFPELIEQFGILRYGRKPRVGDPFAGGGSIPYESGRLGCDVWAADLNPIACMLNWGAFNIIGASQSKRKELQEELNTVRTSIQHEMDSLAYEINSENNRAKAYLYCTEVKCPQTNWSIPVSSSWVLSESKSIIVEMHQNSRTNSFDLTVKYGANKDDLEKARKGTVQNGKVVYSLNNKTFETPFQLLRGDYVDVEGNKHNDLRLWTKSDLAPIDSDVFKERLYAVQWTKAKNHGERQYTYFTEPTDQDNLQEQWVHELVSNNLSEWQDQGLIPSSEIECGRITSEPIRSRGWSHWHHFFNPRQLFFLKCLMYHSKNSRFPAETLVFATRLIDWSNRGCRWKASDAVSSSLFYNQLLNTLWNYGARSSFDLLGQWKIDTESFESIDSKYFNISCAPASECEPSDLFITDPPYADAVSYHEITEFFISWMQGELPSPFNKWVWDSRRALAIKGIGYEFRQKMTEAYSNMSNRMPEHGYQCVMFTHSSVKVWGDITKILWASGLQVVTAWCVATETATPFRDGNHIQGTVLLILKKRSNESRAGYKHIISAKIYSEVENQVSMMLNLGERTKDNLSETPFSNFDIKLAGQAAALKVLTSYTNINGEDVSSFALRSENISVSNVVEEFIDEAVKIADSMLYPDKISKNAWFKLTGIEKFYLQMMDNNSTKLDTYQKYAKLYRVVDYGQLMSCKIANRAKLKLISEFTSRDLAISSQFGKTWLARLITAIQQTVSSEIGNDLVLSELRRSVSDFLLARDDLICLLEFIEVKSSESDMRDAATLLKGQLRNLRIFNQ